VHVNEFTLRSDCFELIAGVASRFDWSTDVATNANLPSRTSCPIPARGGGALVVAGGAAAIAADPAVDEDVDVELLLLLCEPSSPMMSSNSATAAAGMTHLGNFFFGGAPVHPGLDGGAAGPQPLPSQ
jgi:hypothetical protein